MKTDNLKGRTYTIQQHCTAILTVDLSSPSLSLKRTHLSVFSLSPPLPPKTNPHQERGCTVRIKGLEFSRAASQTSAFTLLMLCSLSYFIYLHFILVSV
jgi:hypothetical protein